MSLAPINGPLSLVRNYQQPINNPQKLGIVEQNRLRMFSHQILFLRHPNIKKKKQFSHARLVMESEVVGLFTVESFTTFTRRCGQV